MILLLTIEIKHKVGFVKRKNIIITGASSGLGYTMAQQFAEKGRNLILCARRIEHLTELKAELNELYPKMKSESG